MALKTLENCYLSNELLRNLISLSVELYNMEKSSKHYPCTKINHTDSKIN